MLHFLFFHAREKSEPALVIENIKQTLISAKAKLAAPSLPMVYEYDLQTEKGKPYIFNFRP
jgi:hypothetical protein